MSLNSLKIELINVPVHRDMSREVSFSASCRDKPFHVVPSHSFLLLHAILETEDLESSSNLETLGCRSCTSSLTILQ